jgi:hypothetical protein
MIRSLYWDYMAELPAYLLTNPLIKKTTAPPGKRKAMEMGILRNQPYMEREVKKVV